ncbi:MAG: hypothetical protein RMJ98_01135 [Myxococcales bacterium]|nr:hypothetical protein [Polyangiaceae bacterium]MDW8247891.1 hypothetical protein [Myxococcales bacterium]
MTVTSAEPPLPPDHTLPGELAEGEVKVSGILMPRGFLVHRVFEHQTHVRGMATPEQTANYLRRRLEVGSVDVGPSRTIFSGARVKGKEGPPLRVEVNSLGGVTEVVVIELRTVPIDPSLSEEERWRKAGLRPEGGLLDPHKVF